MPTRTNPGLYGPTGKRMQPATMPKSPNDCPFCMTANGLVLAGQVLYQHWAGYLIQAATREADGRLVPDDGHWLMVPWVHTASLLALPEHWSQTEAMLLEFLFGPNDDDWPPFKLYYLHGKEAGRTVYHVHGHIKIDASA